MADKIVKIPVQAVIQTNAKNMDQIVKDLGDRLSNLKVDSSVSKALSKTLDKIKSQRDDMTLIGSQQIFSESDLRRATSLINRFYKEVATFSDKYEGASFSAFDFDESQLQKVAKAEEKLREFRSEKTTKARNRTVDSVFQEYQEEGKQIKQLMESAGESVVSDSSFKGWAEGLKTEMEKAKQTINSTTGALEELKKQQAELSKNKKAVQAEYDHVASQAEKKYTKENKTLQKASLAKKFSEIGNLGLKSEQQQALTQLLFKKSKDGKYQDLKTVDAAKTALSFFGISESDIPQAAAEIKKKLLEEIQKTDNLGSAFTNAQKFTESNEVQKARKQVGSAVAADSSVVEAGEKLKNASSILAKTDNKITNMETVIQTAQSTIDRLSALEEKVAQLYGQVTKDTQKNNTAMEKKLKQAVEDAQDELLKDYQTGDTKKHSVAVEGMRHEMLDLNEANERKNKEEADANTFKKNIQDAVKQWFSMREIINTVKTGIREAYQDIQGLDKAMTNIAVVTDFNVSDLWGKINEYMSIAQQYGVTTQGVYEVSQLYYQQGLGEADTMAATTETLKMARIAGMGYADAADGMTVAIRGFKMEMADAARVTDVYSKVAAVTASDTQELVEAMSKTASSAASVGASFESTTAMIAVMIEATREAPQNIGSAMKSIISRYGEMTKGLKVDQEGEEIDYNRVDTALKSVGISLKDAQGQFRDFDAVIEELAAKWDTLDSVTQRYVATIFAGNRQQSRFLALVGNYDRYTEVLGAAENSEDAGLLQYSKTLDSLESKLANIKTSFQQFYMNIFNGEFVKGFLDAINAILQGFNKLGSASGIFNLVSIIRGLKTGLTVVGNLFSNSFGSIISSWRARQEELTNISLQGGIAGGRAWSQGFNSSIKVNLPAGVSGGTVVGGQNVSSQAGNTGVYKPIGSNLIMNAQVGNGSGKANWKTNSWNGSKVGQGIQVGGAIAGAALSTLGAAISQNNGRLGSAFSFAGSAAQGASMGAMLGPWGAAIGGIIGGITQIPALIKNWSIEGVMKEKLEKAKKAMEEADLERASKQEEARSLKQTIDNLTKLEKARFDSAEAEQEYIDAQNSAAEKFPLLVAGYDSFGNAIIDLTDAEQQLTSARVDAAKAAQEAALADLAAAKAQQDADLVTRGDKIFGEKGDSLYKYRDGFFSDVRAFVAGPIVNSIFNDFGTHLGTIFGDLDIDKKEFRNLTDAEKLLHYRDKARQGNLRKGLFGKYSVQDFDDKMRKVYGVTEYEAMLASALDAQRAFKKNGSIIQNKQEEAVKANISQTLINEEEFEDRNSSLFKLEGLEEEISKSILESFDFGSALDEKIFSEDEEGNITFTDRGLKKIKKQYNQKIEEFSKFAEELEEDSDLEDFNLLYQDVLEGNYTDEDIEQILNRDYSLSKKSRKQALKYLQSANDKREESVERFSSFLEESDVFSSSNFSKAALKSIEKIPHKYIDAISSFGGELEALVDNGKIGPEQAKEIYSSYLSAFEELDSLKLSKEELGQAREILSQADLMSISGINEAMEQLKKAGLTDEEIDSLNLEDFPLYTSNLVSEYGTLTSKLAENLKMMSDTLKKASEGMDYEGITSLMGEISGLEWSDSEFVNGSWWLTDEGFGKVLDSQFADIMAVGETIQKEGEEGLTKYLGSADYAKTKELAGLSAEERKGFLDGKGRNKGKKEDTAWNTQYFNLQDNLYSDEAFAKWAQEYYEGVDLEENPEFFTGEKMLEFYTYQIEQLGYNYEEALQAVEYYKEDYGRKRNLGITQALFDSQFTPQERNLQEGKEALIGKSGKGYSSAEASSIYHAFKSYGLSQKDFIKTEEGTFEITQSGLNKIPAEYRNQVNALIEDETQSAIDQISSLGESIGSGEATEFNFAEAFSWMSEELGYTSSMIQDIVGKALQKAASSSPEKLEENSYLLDRYIARQLKTSTDDPRVAEARNQMLASYKDSQSESILKYYELLQKKIDGTATEMELLELAELDSNLGEELVPDLDQFNNSFYEGLADYVQALLKNTNISFEDKEKLLQNSFTQMLGAKAFKERFGIENIEDITANEANQMVSFSESMRKIASSKNAFDIDTAGKIATSIASTLGLTPEQVMSMFSYDAETDSYGVEGGLDFINSLINQEAESEIASYRNLYYQGAIDESTLRRKAEEAKRRARQKLGIDEASYQFLSESLEQNEANQMAADIDEVTGFVDTLSSTFETLASGEKVDAEQLLEFYRSFGAELNADELKARMKLSPTELIDQIWADMNAVANDLEGQDQAKVQEAQKKMQELQATLMDALIQSVTDNIGQLISGMSGELSFSDYQKLIDTYGIAADSAALSYSGVTLNKTSQRQLLSKMYREAKGKGIASGFGEEIWKQMSGSEGALFGGYQDVEEEIATVQKLLSSDEGINTLINQWGMAKEEAEAYLEVLRQIRHESMFDENAYEFTFMDQDATDGLTKNFDNFVGQIDKIQGVFQSFQAGEAIGYQDFYNMMDFIKNSESGFAKFSQMTGIAAADYEAFVNSVVANTDQWGKVDIGGVAAEMGISVDAAMEGMAEGMNDSLKEVARQQIKYLSSLESMLEALAILESIGDVGVKLNFEIDINGDGINDAQSWTQLLNTYMNLPEEQQKKADIELRAKMNAEQEGIWNILSPGGIDFWEANVLGNILDNPDKLDSDKVQQILAKANLGQSWAEGVAEYMRESLTFTKEDGQIFDYDSMFVFDENGMATAFNKDFITALSASGITGDSAEEIFSNWFAQYFNELKPEEISESFTSTLNEKFANQPPITIENGPELIFKSAKGKTGTFKLDKDYEIDENGKLSEEYRQEITDEMNTQLAGQNLEVDVDSEESWVVNADGNLEVKYRTLTIDYGDIPDGFFDENELVTQLAGEEGAKKFEVDIPGEITGTVILSEKGWSVKVPDGMDPNEYIDSIIQTMFGEGYGVKDVNLEDETGEHVFQVAPVVAEESEASLTTLQSTLDGIATTLASGLTLNINSTDATNQMNEIEQAFEDMKSTLEQPINLQVNSGTNSEGGIDAEEGVILPDGERTIKITWDAEKIPEQDNVSVGIDWVAPSLPNPGPIEVEVKWKADNLPFPHLKVYTGTMNSITGPAYADGSIGRLATGAQLANKTLVGELGPELAVYDGQYHLLGQTGAEFVNLPKNAIVFNHLQTAGILSGQMKDARGLPLEPGSALAAGNVTGPAMAGGGIGAALDAVRRAKSVWQGLLNSLSAAELLGGGGGGGGGGGNDLKAHIADLQEWYNLSRKIADVEQRINKLLAERELLTDGHAYLRNLRETQALLEDQVNTQEDLLKFQELQLKRQAEHINNNDLWSKFLHVDENGLLQYNEGNETNGGKGALQVLQEMNEMSGEQQTAYLASIGYTYTDNDGNVLEGSELVAKFYEELQKQIDDYDALRDTVNETETALLELEAQINEIEQEIRQNEIDLSQEIYDIIVDAWKENIENLKEQNELIKEANDAYAEGIQKAIDAERQTYEESEAIADREQLQRQLSLLRRSGGSAAEIASLEQQLDDTLKDEYFRNQEKALETIQEANERQVKLMEEQVKLQEEALEYQQENGVIWTKVYEVMQGTDAEILAFMQGHSTSFFEQSFLQQEDMLLDWAKKVGIYNEEKARQNAIEEAKQTFGQAWTTDTGKGLKSIFEGATDSEREKWKREYNEQYAAAILDGKTVEEAIKLAQDELYEHLENYRKKKESEVNNSNNSNNNNNNNNNNNSSNANSGGNNGTTSNPQNSSIGKRYQAWGQKGSGARDYGAVTTNKNYAEEEVRRRFGKSPYVWNGVSGPFAKGGLINFTGPAWVDGSKSKPERILSAEQNKILEEGLAMNAGRGNTLKEAFSSFASMLDSTIKGTITSITNKEQNSSIIVEPGAVVLNVEQLNDSYDIDELYNDITDRLQQIASRSSGRGVSRR